MSDFNRFMQVLFFMTVCNLQLLPSQIMAGETQNSCEAIILDKHSLKPISTFDKSPNDFSFGELNGQVATFHFIGNPVLFEKVTDTPLNFQIRQDLTRKYYEHYGDSYDFLILITDFSYIYDAFAFTSVIRNDIQGIGLDLFDQASFFSSDGKLRALIELGNIAKYLDGNTLDWSVFQETILHEMGHSWLSYISYYKDGQENRELLKGDDWSHWSYLLDSDASLMYGHDWMESTPLHFRSAAIRERYSDLDLYLMGFISAEEMGPLTLLHSNHIPDSSNLFPAHDAQVEASSVETVLISQVIEQNGPRLPEFVLSPKTFRVGFIFLSTTGQPDALSIVAINDALPAVNSFFEQLTKGLGHIDFEHAPRTKDPVPFNTQTALNYLQNQRNTEGLWGNHDSSIVRDSIEAIRALMRHEIGSASSIETLEQFSDRQLDDTARIAQFLAELNRPDEQRLEILLENQQSDGGFSLRKTYQPNFIDTVLALNALSTGYREAFLPAIQNGISWLLDHQMEGPYWGATLNDRAPSLYTTLLIIDFLSNQPVDARPEIELIVSQGLEWAMESQDIEGVLGQNFIDYSATVLALNTSIRLGNLVPEIADYLNQTQSSSGSWNETIYDTALVLNGLGYYDDFGLSDMTIVPSSLTWSPDPIREGTPTTVRCQVQNLGNAPCEGGMVKMYKNPPESGGLLLAEAPIISPLDQEQSQWVDLVWADTEIDSNFEFVLDASSISEDANPNNNRVVLSVTWIGKDPYIQTDSFQISNDSPFQGEMLQLIVHVGNAGSIEAAGFEIGLWLGNPDTNGTLIENKTLPDLSPFSGLQEVHFEWVATAPLGFHSLYLQISTSEDARPENNRVQHTVEILEPIVGLDVGVLASSVTATPDHYQTCPQGLTVECQLVDYGQTHPEGLLVELFLGPISGNRLLATTITDLLNGTETVSLPVTIDSLGDYPLLVKVSPPDGSTDIRPENNVASTSLTGMHLEDFEVQAGSIVASPLIAGQSVQLSAQITNRNVNPRPQVPIHFFVDDGSGPELLGIDFLDILGNATASANLSWTAPETPMSGSIQVIVDHENIYSELDEDDNMGTLPITTLSNDLANLNIQSSDILLEGAPFSEGGALTMHVTFRNSGGSDLNLGELNVFLDHPENPPLVPVTAISNLATGAEETVSIIIDPISFRGDHGLVVVLSTSEEESNQGDNVAFKTLHVSGGPNATFGAVPIELDPVWPADGEQVQVSVSVLNTGDTQANDLVIRLHKNSEHGPILDEKTIQLDSGSFLGTLSFEMSTDLTDLICVLDPQDLIVETNEADNRVALGLVARNSDVAVSQNLFSPNGDGIKDQVTLYWDRPEPEIDITIKNTKAKLIQQWTNQPGSGSVIWNGTDLEGKPSPDGMYLIQWSDPSSGYQLNDTIVQIDTNHFTIRDSLRFSNPEFVNLVSSDTYVGDDWLGWAKSGGFVYGAIPSGPPISVSSDATHVVELWDASSGPIFTLFDKPGYLLSQGDPNFGSPESCTILGPDGRYLESFAIDYWGNGESILDWVDLEHVLIKSEIQNTLKIYNYHQQTSQTLELSDRPWGDIIDSFVSHGSVFVLERLEMDSSSSHAIFKFQLDGFQDVKRIDLSSLHPAEQTVTLARQGQYWIIGLENSVGALEEIVFYDLQSDSLKQWTGMYGPTFPHAEDFYSDARLHRSPLDSGQPDIVVLVDWTTDRRYLVHEDYLVYLEGLISPSGSRTAVSNYANFGLYTTYQNLSLVFEAFLVGGAAVRLQGTATDLNFSNWSVSYASVSQPDQWIPTGIQGDFRKVNGYLGTWIPEFPGAYLLKCSAEDLAGNKREEIVLAQVEGESPFFNASLDQHFFSPNHDGNQDLLTLNFEVRTPFEGHLSIYDAVGNNIRYLNNYYGSIAANQLVWDGTTDQGQTVSDGNYRLNLNGMDFWVTVDTTTPLISFDFQETIRDTIAETTIVTPYSMNVQDLNLNQWRLEYRKFGELDWKAFRSAGTSYQSNTLEPDYLDTANHVLHHEWKLTAEDLAGNEAVWTGSAELSPHIWTLRTGSKNFVESGVLANTTPGGIQALNFIALLPANRFPITLTELSIDGNPIFNPVANQTQFSGNPVRPGITTDNLPSNASFRFRAVFTDVFGQTYVTEELSSLDFKFQIDLKSIDPVPNTHQYQVNLTLLGSEQTQYDLGAYAKGALVGSIDGSIQFQQPLPFGPRFFRSGEPNPITCRDLYPYLDSDTLWPDSNPDFWQGKTFFIKDLILFPGTTNEMHVGDTLTKSFCREGMYIAFQPMRECSDQDQIRFHNPDAQSLPSDLGHIQFFADDQGLQPISDLINMSAPQPFTIDFSNFEMGAWNDLYAIVKNLNGENYFFSFSGKNKNHIQLVLFHVEPGSIGSIQSVGELYRTHQVPVFDFPDQILCTPSQLELNIYQPCQNSLPRINGPILTDLDYLVQGQLEFVPFGLNHPILDVWAHPVDDPSKVINLYPSCPNGYALPSVDIGRLMENGHTEPDWIFYLQTVNEQGICDVVSSQVLISDTGQPSSSNLRMRPQSVDAVNPFSSAIEAQIVFEMDTPAFISAWIESIEEPSQTIVVLESGAEYSSGASVLEWNGENTQGNQVADGTYRCVVHAQQPCGNGKSVSQLVVFDNEPPSLTIHEPLEGPLETPTQIIISALDQFKLAQLKATLFPEGHPEEFIILEDIEDPPFFNYEPLTHLSFGESGSYTIRVQATDAALNESSNEKTVTINPSSVIERFELSESWISPNGDSVQDGFFIHLGLSHSALVDLYVSNGTSPYWLLNQQTISTPDFDYYFDGTHQGIILQDDHYDLHLEAQDGGVQSRTIGFHVDTQLPYLGLSSPDVSKVHSQFPISVHGSIQDNGQIRDWKAELRIENLYSAIGAGYDSVSDGPIGELNNVPEGNHQIILSATDRAGNRHSSSFPFVVDLTPPQLQIEQPATDQLFGATSPLIISGTYVETSPKSMVFWLVQNGDPIINLGSLTPSEFGPTDFVFETVPDNLPDGQFQLLIQMEDLANHMGTSLIPITIDRLPPIAVLDAFPNGGFISRPFSIRGTAKDPSLSFYEISIRSALVKRDRDGFTRLFRGVHTKDNEELYFWATLPPDGSYEVRLFVQDRFGREAYDHRTLSIDATPPDSPAQVTLESGSYGIAPNKQSYVQLSWPNVNAADLSGYIVYRNGQAITESPMSQTSYEDDPVPDGNWIYQVQAIDLSGNKSVDMPSAEVVLDTTAPNPFIVLPEEGAIVGGIVNIFGSVFDERLSSWTLDVGEGVVPIGWIQLAQGIQNRSFDLLSQWITVSSNPGTYHLRLRASDTFGNVGTHNIEVQVENAPPSQPSKPTVELSGSRLRISWTPNSEGDMDHYRVFRDGAYVGDADYSVFFESVPDGTYVYQVIAVDQAGNQSPLSPPSAPYQLDENDPRAFFVTPQNGHRFEELLIIEAQTVDNDIQSVIFNYRPQGNPSWNELVVDAERPWSTTWNASMLPDGVYELSLVAVEQLSGDLDPSPPVIQVEIGDTTRPGQVQNLEVHQLRDRVELDWDDNPESDLQGYRIFQNDVQINEVTVSSAEIQNLQSGTWNFKVAAVDQSGNQGTFSESISVHRFAPNLSPPALLSDFDEASVMGTGSPIFDTVKAFESDTEIAQAQIDPLGGFVLPVSISTSGPHELDILQVDATGQESISSPLFLLRTESPNIPAGFQAEADTQTRENILLSWNVPIDPVVGFQIIRNGVSLTGTDYCGLSEIIVSSGVPDGLNDGEESTIWESDAVGSPQIEIGLSNQCLLQGLNLSFHPDSHLPLSADVEFWLFDHWVKIWDFPCNLTPDLNTHLLGFTTRWIWSDRLRITFQTENHPVVLEELQVQQQLLLPNDQYTYLDPEPGQGHYEFTLKAWNEFGLHSESPIQVVGLGDYTPPLPPEDFQGVVQGSDVLLTWNASPSADVAYYRIYRDGRILADTQNTQYLDGNLHRGSYTYFITAIDHAGNESQAAPEIALQVQNGSNERPQLSATVDQQTGRIRLSWVYSEPSDFLTYRVFKRVEDGPWNQRSEPVLEPWDSANYSDQSTEAIGAELGYKVAAVDQMGREFFSNEVILEQPLLAPKITFPVHAGEFRNFSESVFLSGVGQPGTIIKVFKDQIFHHDISALNRQRVDHLADSISEPLSIASDPSDRFIAVSPRTSSRIVLHDLTNQFESNLDIDHRGHDLAFNPEGSRLAFIDKQEMDPQGSLRISNLSSMDIETIVTGVKGPLTWLDDYNLLFVQDHQIKQLNLLNQHVQSRYSDQVDAIVTYCRLNPMDGLIVQQEVDGVFQLLCQIDDQSTVKYEQVEPFQWVYSPSSNSVFITSSSGQLSVLKWDSLMNPIFNDPFDLGEIIDFESLISLRENTSDLVIKTSGNILEKWHWDGELLMNLGPLSDHNQSFGSRIQPNGELLTAYFKDGHFQIHRIRQEGFFGSLFTNLHVGQQTLQCVASDHANQTLSGLSKPIEVEYSLQHLPDLHVSQGDVSVLPSVCLLGYEVFAIANFQNSGSVDIENLPFVWALEQPDGSIIEFAQTPIPLVHSGQTMSLGLTIPGEHIASSGLYYLRLELDHEQIILEQNETNNKTEAYFLVSESTGLDLDLVLVDHSLLPQEDLHFTAIVGNTGPVLSSLSLTPRIETMEGITLSTLQSVAIPSLDVNGIVEFEFSLPTSSFLAGSYRLIGALYQNGELLRDHFTEWSIQPDLRLSSTFISVPIQVNAGDPISGAFNVSNTSLNLFRTGLSAQIDLKQGDDILGQIVLPISDLLPNQSVEVPFSLPTSVLIEGAFDLEMRIFENDHLLGMDSREIQIVIEEIYSVGSGLYIDPLEVYIGDDIEAQYLVTNQGNRFVQLDLSFSLEDSSQTQVSEHSLSVSLAPGEQSEGVISFETQNLDPGVFNLTMSNAQQQGALVAIDKRSFVTLLGNQIPSFFMTGIPDNFITDSAVSIHVEVIDDDNPLPIPELLLNQLPYEMETAITQDGDYQFEARVEDSHGNTAERLEQFRIDTTEPIITVHNIEDGQSFTNLVIPDITILDASLIETVYRLNDHPYELNTPIDQEGSYLLFIQAEDYFGKVATEEVHFSIYSGSNLITIEGVAQGESYNHSVSVSVNVDPSASLTFFKINGLDQGSPMLLDEEESYVIHARATDGVVTQDAMVGFKIDLTSPEIDITGIENHRHYNHAVYPFIWVDGEPLQDGNVMLNGIVFEPGTRVAEERFHQIAVSVQDPAGNPASLIEDFTIDLTPPGWTISGVTNNQVSHNTLIINWTADDDHLAGSSATLNGSPVTSPLEVTQSGQYRLELVANDESGNVSTEALNFTVVGVEPIIVITGVEDGDILNHPVTIEIEVYDSNRASYQSFLNGLPFHSGSTVFLENQYNLVVEAMGSNGSPLTQDIQFVIDKTPPSVSVSGVHNGGYYYQPVFPTYNVHDTNYNSSSSHLNGIQYVPGTSLSAWGAYEWVISATDLAGNQTTKQVQFTLGDQPDIYIDVVGVDDGAYYSGPVQPEVHVVADPLTSETIHLNGQPFSSGSSIAVDGSYTLQVDVTSGDLNESQSVSFVVDQTPPEIEVTGVSNGQSYGWSIAPQIEIMEAWPAEQQILLNQLPFVSGTPLLTSGNYTLTVMATDLAGNLSEHRIDFDLEITQEMIAEPDPLTFEHHSGPLEKSFRIHNNTTNQVQILDPVISGSHHDVFSIVSLDPQTIESGASVTGVLRFDPSEPGNFSAELSVSTDLSSSPQIRLPLNGERLNMDLDLTPKSFGPLVRVGSIKPILFEIQSLGSAPTGISAVDLVDPEGYLVTTSLPISVESGHTETVTIEFQPNHTQSYYSQIRLNTDDSFNPEYATYLCGRGYEPLEWIATPHSFELTPFDLVQGQNQLLMVDSRSIWGATNSSAAPEQVLALPAHYNPNLVLAGPNDVLHFFDAKGSLFACSDSGTKFVSCSLPVRDALFDSTTQTFIWVDQLAHLWRMGNDGELSQFILPPEFSSIDALCIDPTNGDLILPDNDNSLFRLPSGSQDLQQWIEHPALHGIRKITAGQDGFLAIKDFELLSISNMGSVSSLTVSTEPLKGLTYFNSDIWVSFENQPIMSKYDNGNLTPVWQSSRPGWLDAVFQADTNTLFLLDSGQNQVQKAVATSAEISTLLVDSRLATCTHLALGTALYSYDPDLGLYRIDTSSGSMAALGQAGIGPITELVAQSQPSGPDVIVAAVGNLLHQFSEDGAATSLVSFTSSIQDVKPHTEDVSILQVLSNETVYNVNVPSQTFVTAYSLLQPASTFMPLSHSEAMYLNTSAIYFHDTDEDRLVAGPGPISMGDLIGWHPNSQTVWMLSPSSFDLIRIQARPVQFSRWRKATVELNHDLNQNGALDILDLTWGVNSSQHLEEHPLLLNP